MIFMAQVLSVLAAPSQGEGWAQLTSDNSISLLCKEVGGLSFGVGADAGKLCAVQGQWTTLSNKDNEQRGNGFNASAFAICKELSGHSFGSTAQFCALRGSFTQLYGTELCAQIAPHSSFGNSNQFCAVKGLWTTLANVDDNVTRAFPSCADIEGYPSGSQKQFCTVRGAWTTLSSAPPGGDRTPISFCSPIGGHTFGSKHEFCAVENYTQLSNVYEGRPITFSECSELNGRAFGNIHQFCALTDFTQLNNTDYLGAKAFPRCNELGGRAFGVSNQFCAAPGKWAILTSDPSGTSPSRSPITFCGDIGGHSFGSVEQFCAVVTLPPPPPAPTPHMHPPNSYPGFSFITIGGVIGCGIVAFVFMGGWISGVLRRRRAENARRWKGTLGDPLDPNESIIVVDDLAMVEEAAAAAIAAPENLHSSS
jgi:hypothetical protein